MENPKNVAASIILITDSRTDFSLPYLVYTTKTIKAINPIKRKIHDKTHNVKEGNSAICGSFLIFFLVYFKVMIFFFLIL